MIDLGSFVIACDICDTYRKQTLLADSLLIVTAYLGMLIDLGSFVIACDICDTYRTQTLPGKLFDDWAECCVSILPHFTLLKYIIGDHIIRND